MLKALSMDLRERVPSAVPQGLSHRATAKRFEVSAASISRWRKREREQGDALPRALGGDRRSARIDAHMRAILEALDRTGTPPLKKFAVALRHNACCSASA